MTEIDGAIEELLRNVRLPRRSHLQVFLCEPFLELRRVSLPPMNLRDARAVVERNMVRFQSPGSLCDALVAMRRLRDDDIGEAVYLAVFARDALVRTLEAKARQWRFRVSIHPAEEGWAAAAVGTARTSSQSNAPVAVSSTGTILEIHTEDGFVVGNRRHRMSSGRSHQAQEADALIRVVTTQARTRVQIESDGQRAHRARGARLRAWVAVGLAVASIAFSAVIGRLRIETALRDVARRRAAIHSDVTKALTARNAIGAIEQRLDTIASLDGRRVHWSRVVADIAQTLPLDAHLVGMRASGDSLEIEGVGVSASPVFDGLRSGRTLTDVRAAAPIRQELRDGAPPVVRFALSARAISARVGK